MKWLRTIHLILGLFCLPMLLTYALDGVRSSHGTWFRGSESARQYTLPVRAETSANLVNELIEEHGLVADPVAEVEAQDFRMKGPLKAFEVHFDRIRHTASVKEIRGGLVLSAHSLHVSSGIHHAHWAATLWGWLVVFVSTALICLGVTGVWLWTRRLRERRLGLLFVLGSLGYCIVCLVLIVMA